MTTTIKTPEPPDSADGVTSSDELAAIFSRIGRYKVEESDEYFWSQQQKDAIDAGEYDDEDDSEDIDWGTRTGHGICSEDDDLF